MDSDIEGRNDEDAVLDITPEEMVWMCCCSKRGHVSTSEITTIEISCDQRDNKYFIGEDATILASFGNPSAVTSVEWTKKTGIVYHPINTTLQKYTGSTCSNEVEKPMLIIKDCTELDSGTYLVTALCNHAIPIDSHGIDLKVVKGPPRVTLNPVPLALENKLVEIKATIRGFPKCQSVIWMKDDLCIDTTDPKYEGSVNNCEFPVLCIKEVKERDNGVYKLIARNELGEGESCEDLEVIGKSHMLFISGPIVVSPLETITFQAYLPRRGNMNAKWWKIKDQSKEELKDDQKYRIIYQTNDTVCFEIFWADKEDSAAYQLSLGKRRSNKINVLVDDSGTFSTSKQGNCLRLFELQSVSADAMRIVLDKMPKSFSDKIEQYCNLPPNSKTKNDLLTGLHNKTITKSEHIDISLMYSIIRNLWRGKNPQNGWGKDPMNNHIETADDIERIRHYRNMICHSDASGIDINLFNFSCLDLFRAIGRLSSDNSELIKTSCEIMNRVYTKGEYLQEMIEKIEKEKKSDEDPIHEDPSSPLSFSHDEDRDDDPMPRASPSSSNKDISSPSSSVNENMDEDPRPRASPFSTNRDLSSLPSLFLNEDRDEAPRPRSSLFLTNQETHYRSQRTERPMSFTNRRFSDHEDSETHYRAQRTERPMSYADRRFSNNADIETHYRAQRTERPMSYADRRFSDNADSETHYRAQRTESPMSYADRRFSDRADSETHYRAQRTERPFSYVDGRFFDNADSETHYRTQRTERPFRHADRRFFDNADSETRYRAQRIERLMRDADRRFSHNADSETRYRAQRTERPFRYADRRFSHNADSESLNDTRITTRSGEIEQLRFHEVCDPEIMMHDNNTTAIQSKPYGGGMFFMNRPMKLQEKIHIYGFSYSNASFRESRPKIKIGLTNTDPEEIREAVNQKKYYVRGLKEIKCFSDGDQTTDFFHIYICLCSNATLSICVNGLQEYFYKNEEISSFNSIWLVIEPYGIDSIKILNN